LKGKKRFNMDFRDETPKANKTKPKTKAATAAAKKKGAVLRNPSVKDVFVGQDYWDSDEDYNDAIEESPPVTIAKRVYPKRTMPTSAAGTNSLTGNGSTDSQSK
jgi:hypothetical protein